MPDWGIVARIVHVLAIVVWIGGVWFVTMVLLPALRRRPPGIWLEEFERIEGRFAPQAAAAVVLALLSGVYMLHRYDMWSRFAAAEFWWMHLMVAVWVLFAALLLAEPVVFGRVVRRRAQTAPEAALRLVLRLHRVLLVVSLAAIAGAVGGAHGLF